MGTESNDQRNEVLTRLKIATGLCSCFLVVEAIGGYLSGSLAVLSDAAHLFADLAGFAVAIAASYLANMPASEWHTYGLKRAESLAALLSMLSLVFVSLGLAYEATMRLISGNFSNIDGPLMSIIAAIGVFVNIVLAFVLGEHHIHLPGADHSHDHDHGECSGGDHHHGNKSRSVDVDHSDQHHHGHAHSHDHIMTSCADEHIEHSHQHSEKDGLLHGNHMSHDHGSISRNGESSGQRGVTRNVNLHAAYVHVLGDLAQSTAVLIAGLVVWRKPEWAVIDPIVTLLFCFMVLLSTVGILKSSVSVLLEQVPANLSVTEVQKEIASVPGVTNVHALHIWSISHGHPALSVHCVASSPGDAMAEINRICLSHSIRHSTLQVQPAGLSQDNSCVTCNDDENCLCHSTKDS